MKVLSIIGTRPEAIKMIPVIKQLENNKYFKSTVCVTAQHREMLDQVLRAFDVKPDYDLNIMEKNQTLIGLSTRIMNQLEPLLSELKPDVILVHGDTATTLAAGLAAFYSHIPVMHIEAGLRTYNIHSPWPEEAHRRLTSVITELHFAPSRQAAQHLYDEHIHPDKVIVTGNTVIDALFMAKKLLSADRKLLKSIENRFEFLDKNKKTILLTVHRRENIGQGVEKVIKAVRQLSEKYYDLQFVIPVHLNPKVKEPLHEQLAHYTNVHLIEPQDYLPFVWLMSNSTIILTDSGGIQEEAPSLNVPVLVLRDHTERQEALNAGTIRLIGTHTATIVSEVSLLLDHPKVYKKISQAENPYGNGNASKIIVDAIEKHLKSKKLLDIYRLD